MDGGKLTHCVNEYTLLHAGVLLLEQSAVVKSLRDLVAALPYFAEANCRVVPIENGQRRADVGDDSPWPLAEKFRLHRMGVHSALFQRYNSPLLHTTIEKKVGRNII